MSDSPAHEAPTAPPPASPASAAETGMVDPSVRVTVPVKRRIRLRDLWRTFPVGWMLGQRDMKARYAQSALGPLWLVLQPAGMLLAIAITFSAVTNVATGDVPYVVFALVGLGVWIYFQLAFTQATISMQGNAQLIRRSPVPRVAMVTGTMIGVLPQLAVVLAASVVAAAIVGKLPVQALLMPVLVLWLLGFVWAMTMLVTAVAARARDVVNIAPLVLQAGLFVSPVGYPLEGVDRISDILALNPIAGLIESWRWALLDVPPSEVAIIAALVWTVALGAFGWYVFGRTEIRVADYV